MPWKESSPMDEKIKFVATYLEGSYSFTSLCDAFEISRKTGYKWLNRYAELGAEGLSEQSRAPKNTPHKLSEGMKDLLIKTKREHPSWGPKKVAAWLELKYSSLKIPAPSTVGELFKKVELVTPREKIIRKVKHKAPVVKSDEPNSVWCADYKGEFRLGNGQLCYPLTITDHLSRFILCCSSHDRPDYLQTRNAFNRVFLEYGLPKAILTDNGTPFSSPSGLSQLNVWWIKLGILPIRTQPGKPQQNGRHERMHRTLKRETAYPPQQNIEKQQLIFDNFVYEYNFERPHASLNNQSPSSLYVPSNRELPSSIKEFEYDKYMEIKRAGLKGEIRWKGKKYFLGRALEGETVALEEKDDGLWLVHFGPVQIGYINRTSRRVEKSTKSAIKVSPMSPV